MSAERIDAEEGCARVKSGALLVCAYDDDAKFLAHQAEGAISLAALQAQEELMPKDREIIFYCA